MVYKFSFANWAEQIILQRQVKKQADTFMIIYGVERSGKTTLGFNILLPYIKLMKDIATGDYLPKFIPQDYPKDKLWDPRGIRDGQRHSHVRMSDIFKNNFAGDSFDAAEKIKKNPPGSPVFIDEGIDVASWMEQMQREQKGLVHLLKKSGKKLMPTIMITPSMSLLNKEMLRRAHYLFLIINEPKNNENHAYLFKNYDNPILREQMPFGFKGIVEDITKRKDLRIDQEGVNHYLQQRERMMGVVKFKVIDPKVYDLYDKLVKDPLINKSNPGKKYVTLTQHAKMKYMFDTLLYNLHTKDEKSYAQINRLLIDKFGNALTTQHTIRSYIESVAAAEAAKELMEADVLSTDEERKIKVGEDEEVDL